MFTDLAFIDWIALVFSTILIAAAAVSAGLAYASGKSRQGPLLRTPDGGRLWNAEAFHGRRSPEHATISLSKPLRTSSVGAHAAVMSAGGRAPSAALSHDDEEHLTEVAARAARLAGRPVQDLPPAPLRSSEAEPETLTHGSSLVLTGDRSRSLQKRTDVNLVEGFKARTPGFFEDPVGRHELRYWDGHQWTEYVKEHGERFTDPL